MLTLLSLGFSVPMAIVIGGGAGWLLDRWLGTAPWLFLVFLGFGIVAGLRNVVRAASAVAGNDPPDEDSEGRG
jgi:ATP synthase protein I